MALRDAFAGQIKAAMAAGLGSKPDWKFEDFFKLSPTEEHNLKKTLAFYLTLQYEIVNLGQPTAVPIDGVPAYRPEAIADLHKKCLNAAVAGTPPPDPTVATVISALFVKWCAPGKVFNVGYVGDWISKNAATWDRLIERRAGGLQSRTSYAAQHLTLSNQSSLCGLIAIGVEQYLHGAIDEHIAAPPSLPSLCSPCRPAPTLPHPIPSTPSHLRLPSSPPLPSFFAACHPVPFLPSPPLQRERGGGGGGCGGERQRDR